MKVSRFVQVCREHQDWIDSLHFHSRIMGFTEQKVPYVRLIGSCWYNQQNQNSELLSLIIQEHLICNKLVKFKWGKYVLDLKIPPSAGSSFPYSAL